MRKLFSAFLVAIVLFALSAPDAISGTPGKGALATIAGSVNDSKGNPVAGALVSLLKEGAKSVAKQVKTDANGRFSTRISPGRYGIRAIAAGFNEVVFSSVEVRASQELIYRFNLEPTGAGKTLPEQRKDRNDVKWTLRSAQRTRSIFQAQEGEADDIKSVLASDTETAELPADVDPDVRVTTYDSRPQGVVETFAATSAEGASYAGLNFAIAAPASEEVELVFAGQTGVGQGAPGRFEALGRIRAGDHHRINMSVGGMRFAKPIWTTGNNQTRAMGQFSVRAVDEWIVRDGVVILLGLDYSRFVGGGGASTVSPRVGIQFDADPRTRVTVAYRSGGEEQDIQSFAAFEDAQVAFKEANIKPIAYIDGQAVMERSHRLEFGVERVLDNNSNVVATAFFDTTTGRGVGLMSLPMSSLGGATGESLISVANQQGAARGMRVVYHRRLSHVWSASAGYALGRGQRLSADGFTHPGEVFTGGFFHTAAFEVGAGFNSGTHVRTVLRFSPEATVFAIDPFAGRLGVYDPSLSIQVTQELPSFGLPVRAEAILDARNLLDMQVNTDNGEVLTLVPTGRRSVRGGISLRF